VLIVSLQSLENMTVTGDEIRMVMKAVALGTHGSYGGHWCVHTAQCAAAALCATQGALKSKCRCSPATSLRTFVVCLTLCYRFQCKNGHPYAIGECGGAMQQSRCPECGEVIGGANHAIDATNSVAHSLLQLARMELGQDP
jgi:hypothetical protein